MILEKGTYNAMVKDVSVYLRGENNRLTAAFLLDVDGVEIKSFEWLELNDGTLSTKTIARLRKVFPFWDGTIETLDAGHGFAGTECEIVVINEPGKDDPTKIFSKVTYMNPLGGGGDMPEPADKKTLVAKYGAKFRALSGGVPPAKKTAPPAPAAPAKAGKTSTLEECWGALSAAHDGETRDQLTERWFAILEKVAQAKDQAEYTPEEWGRAMTIINLPF